MTARIALILLVTLSSESPFAFNSVVNACGLKVGDFSFGSWVVVSAGLRFLEQVPGL